MNALNQRVSLQRLKEQSVCRVLKPPRGSQPHSAAIMSGQYVSPSTQADHKGRVRSSGRTLYPPDREIPPSHLDQTRPKFEVDNDRSQVHRAAEEIFNRLPVSPTEINRAKRRALKTLDRLPGPPVETERPNQANASNADGMELRTDRRHAGILDANIRHPHALRQDRYSDNHHKSAVRARMASDSGFVSGGYMGDSGAKLCMYQRGDAENCVKLTVSEHNSVDPCTHSEEDHIEEDAWIVCKRCKRHSDGIRRACGFQKAGLCPVQAERLRIGLTYESLDHIEHEGVPLCLHVAKYHTYNGRRIECTLCKQRKDETRRACGIFRRPESLCLYQEGLIRGFKKQTIEEHGDVTPCTHRWKDHVLANKRVECSRCERHPDESFAWKGSRRACGIKGYRRRSMSDMV